MFCTVPIFRCVCRRYFNGTKIRHKSKIGLLKFGRVPYAHRHGRKFAGNNAHNAFYYYITSRLVYNFSAVCRKIMNGCRADVSIYAHIFVSILCWRLKAHENIYIIIYYLCLFLAHIKYDITKCLAG